jgi:hypothetical protein
MGLGGVLRPLAVEVHADTEVAADEAKVGQIGHIVLDERSGTALFAAFTAFATLAAFTTLAALARSPRWTTRGCRVPSPT